MQPLKIALPKGRLLDPTSELLAAVGIQVPRDRARRLTFASVDGSAELMLVKPADVATYVELGAADLGVVGTDVLLEGEPDVLRPLALGYGACRIVVAELRQPRRQGAGRRVATKYPGITRRYFAEQRVPVEVITLSGSVELAPLVGLADWIVDLVETGATLRENGLEPIAEIATTEAQLVVNRASHKTRRADIGQLIRRLTEVVSC